MRLQRHRNIEVGGATLECTIYGSGTPVVLLANAGCSTIFPTRNATLNWGVVMGREASLLLGHYS